MNASTPSTTSTPQLTIGLVLPDVLGTYGDDGNALVLRQRARMRGITAEIHQIRYGEPVPEQLDIYTVGGGEDVAQILAAEHLIADGGITRAVNAGRPLLAICAGLQVFGYSFRASDRIVDGLGLIDATTSSLEKRMIGEICSTPVAPADSSTTSSAAPSEVGASIVAALGEESLTGFANHQGATILGPDAHPLGYLTRGTGNTDQHGVDTHSGTVSNTGEQTRFEGAVQGSIVATYMHGPVLARNPHLADALLAAAMDTTVAKLPEFDPEFHGGLPQQLSDEVRQLRKERLG